MKITKLLILVLLFVVQSHLTAQWQPDVRLTNDPAYSCTNEYSSQCIAAGGGFVYTVWFDQRDGNYEIYYKRSVNQGSSWFPDVRLTNNAASSVYPCLAVSGSLSHVVWVDDRDGNEEIYYKRAINYGAAWENDVRLTNNPSISYVPIVTASGTDVYVVWEDLRDGNSEIYFKKALENGIYWGNDVRLTNNSAKSYYPFVAASGTIVHVAWGDERNGNEEIYYKRSTNAGQNWSADTRLTYQTAQSRSPFIAVSGSVVHLAWHDNRDGNWEIYYQRSLDGGVNWSTATRLTNNNGMSNFPGVSVSGYIVHVVWCDDRNGNLEIYYKRSTNSGQNWGSDTRLTNNAAISFGASVSASGSNVHVVWTDGRDGNLEIYYKQDPTGNAIGIKNISSEVPKEFSLSQNYPNPFNPATNFELQIAKFGLVLVIVYDILGREVATLVNEQLQPGTYEVEFDDTNYPSGVYFYKLIAVDASSPLSITKKMVLLK